MKGFSGRSTFCHWEYTYRLAITHCVTLHWYIISSTSFNFHHPKRPTRSRETSLYVQFNTVSCKAPLGNNTTIHNIDFTVSLRSSLLVIRILSVRYSEWTCNELYSKKRIWMLSHFSGYNCFFPHQVSYKCSPFASYIHCMFRIFTAPNLTVLRHKWTKLISPISKTRLVEQIPLRYCCARSDFEINSL